MNKLFAPKGAQPHSKISATHPFVHNTGATSLWRFIWSVSSFLHCNFFFFHSGDVGGKTYILKGGICGYRIPQTIWNFRRKIVWERKKYQDYTVCRANWRSFPLLMLSHCNKLSIKTLKHTIFSMKIPHWHQILVIFMIYALLSRNFDVRIYALFPQIFGNWKVDSADLFTFRMYVRVGW